MASKKNIKKDINYLTDDLIGTCIMHQNIGSKKNKEGLNQIIEDILLFRDDLIKEVNNPELPESAKTLRSYYRELYQKLLKKVDETYDKINAIAE